MATIINLKSMDEQIITADVETISLIPRIRRRMENADEDNIPSTILVEMVDGYTLENVLIWAEHYAKVIRSSPSGTYHQSEWDAYFLGMPKPDLYDLLRAALHLEFWELLQYLYLSMGVWNSRE